MFKLLLPSVFSSAVMAIDNGLALTPPMGINPYSIGGEPNEQIMHDLIDVVIKEGLDKLGYNYINIDEGWEAWNRTADGKLTYDVNKYPSGMKALADHIHSKGLKFGLYSDAGLYTCGLHPGSLGHEKEDA